jgi:hypothetical protein
MIPVYAPALKISPMAAQLVRNKVRKIATRADGKKRRRVFIKR